MRKPPPRFSPDAITVEVMRLVGATDPSHSDDLSGFNRATDRAGAPGGLALFIAQALPRFGEGQDAMLLPSPVPSQSRLSPHLNIGLLGPLEICPRAEAVWRAGRVPINAAEGFIRQISGWREYIRGIDALRGPGYMTCNALYRRL